MLKSKNVVKIVATCLTMSIILGIGTVLVSASNDVKVVEKYTYSTLSGVDSVVSGGNIIVNGEENELYRVFSNQDNAIKSIKTKVPELLDTISKNYDLSALSDSNWEIYRDAMMEMLDSENKPMDYNESDADFICLSAFFDIYENKIKNDEIIDYVAKESLERSINSNELNELALMLPCDAPVVKEFMASNVSSMSRAPIFVEDAIEYATAHATNRNKTDYHSFSNGDCTNFVSQIIENAGVNQVVYESEYSGWWHKKTKNWLGITTHKHSRSWTMADTFTRYMGVYYSTKSHYNFSANIVAGSIIALDKKGDGDWDHMGFVTDRKSTVGNVGYYNYKVAQHTSDYHEWAATSKCGWDEQSDKCVYARVRG